MTNATFDFISDATGGDKFTVISFQGHEEISRPYQYNIELKAPTSALIDLDDVLENRARFIYELNGVEYPVNGILASFEEYRTVLQDTYYRAVLVPKLWKLSIYKTNEIFYQPGEGSDAGQTLVDIITQVFERAEFSSIDFDISGLQGDLLKREYICQYNESNLNFISRLLENEGIFYYFEQSDTEEKVVFMNNQDYLDVGGAALKFDVAAMTKNQDDCVHAWCCRKQRLPNNVVVRDYNPEEPSLDVSDTANIDQMGEGTEYIYGKNVVSDLEATYISEIRAQEINCRKTQFFGESSVSRLRAGYLFSLSYMENEKYDGQEYLTVSVDHEGQNLDMSQSQSIDSKATPQYQNSFVAIPYGDTADTQFRPQRITPKPRITGTLHARIDGELDSEYAQLDEQGRYKVNLPFDFQNENHTEGLASARIRMIQPYAGENRGMQFPMIRGTEVLLSFVDGDPDRPMIAGAISTPSLPGPVSADNQSESVIQTGGKNKIRFEDKMGSERVMMESPTANSWVRIGAQNDPITLIGESPYIVGSGDVFDPPGAVSHSGPLDQRVESAEFAHSSVYDYSTMSWVADVDSSTPGWYALRYESGSDLAYRWVQVVDDEAVDVAGTDSDGIRIQSAGNLWKEAKSRTGDYQTGHPVIMSSADPGKDAPLYTHDMLAKFNNSSYYQPDGLLNYATKQAQTFANAIANAQVTVSSLDTITTQEGNIYDFGGYWNYNLGNSYAENHMGQAETLNAVHRGDILNAGGPNFTGWRTADIDDSADSGADTDVKKDDNVSMAEGSNGTPTIWVDKSFGDSYEYTSGNSISVTKGSTQEIEIGGAHIEEAYRGDGSKKSWSQRGVSGEPSKEKKWNSKGTLVYESETTVEDSFINDMEKKYDRFTGAIYSHTHSQGSGMGLAKFEFDYSNSIAMVINSGTVTGMETYIGMKSTMSNHIAMYNSMDNFLGGKFSMENYLGVDMSLKNFAGIKCEIANSAGAIIEIKNGSTSISMPGMTAKLKAMETETRAQKMETALNKMSTTAFDSYMNGLTSIA